MKPFSVPSKAHKAQMRIYGMFCLASGMMFLFLYYVNTFARAHGGHDLFYALGYGIALSALGGLLFALRIWAEVIFSLCLVVLALGLVYAIIMDDRSSPEVLYNIPLVIFFLVPVFLSLQRLRKGAYFQRGA